MAEAKAEGKDTTVAFHNEINQYRRELLEPYLADSTFIFNLVDVAALRDKEEIEASHIMLPRTLDESANIRNKEILDSLKNEINNGASFAAIAREYSKDRSVERNGGYLGYIIAGKFPYAFETAVYETPEGEISEVIASPVGLHIVKPGKHRKSRGKVEVAHIMKMVSPNSEEAEKNSQKNLIDSIYQVVVANPDLFSELAIEYSDDKGSARNGGLLPYFGTGDVVPEFEEESFRLEVGEISQPIRTNYGWHIIKKLGTKPERDYSEIKNEVIKKIANSSDPRYSLVEAYKYKKLREKHGFGKGNEDLLIAEEEWQYANNEEYRNLINEYTDGSMLYEVSLDKVWNKAMEDNEGLNTYFKKHIGKYKWDTPYAKGVLVQAKTDSIGDLIKKECSGMSPDSIISYIKTHYSKDAIAEKIVMAKGVNGMIDHLMWGEKKVPARAKGYQTYFMLDGRIINQPEEMADVRGAVTTDYQEFLENEWVTEMKNKYKVEINKKELSKLRKKWQKVSM